ncbi:hypothetical protein Acr_00g0023040 [Actinidia rufa]|uniref:Uncharacterized protein n=1 Tax=Actinidia rufa TaxID=165716 RepID=A0A7J0DCQ3_9ERIC|nr:hypothetical protein Acr_00g0023040 [Actinidia rufa]
MATTSTSTAASSGGGRGGRAASNRSREGSAKAMVADQTSQAVQSTSNLLHLMHISSPSQAPLSLSSFAKYCGLKSLILIPVMDMRAFGENLSSRSENGTNTAHLMKLPRNLLAKTSTIKNTELRLEQMPRCSSSENCNPATRKISKAAR